MLNFISRYFSSAGSFLTAPFRSIWRWIKRMFPERDFTVMDTLGLPMAVIVHTANNLLINNT
jgi:hypothetical protein